MIQHDDCSCSKLINVVPRIVPRQCYLYSVIYKINIDIDIFER